MKRTDPRIRSYYVEIFVLTTGASLGTFAHSGKITAADLVIAVAIGLLTLPFAILISILLGRLMGLSQQDTEDFKPACRDTDRPSSDD